MNILAVILALAVAQAAVVPEGILKKWTKSIPHSGRIINGNVASPTQFPYQAGLFPDGVSFCGGTLISADWVLTAAQCVKGSTSWVVFLGSVNLDDEDEFGRQTTTSQEAIYHENYDENLRENDIGVVRLPDEVTLNQYVKIVDLPHRTDTGSTFVGTTVVASGWGYTSDSSTGITSILRYVYLSVISNGECDVTYGILPDTAICTSGDRGNICIDDVGGPIVDSSGSSKKQLGVISYGVDSGCQAGYPAVHTRLTSYLDWIARNTGVPIS